MTISVGEEIPPLCKPPIDRTQLVRYAAASGDFNRIHHDEPFAKEAGFPSVIAHGMLSMGFLAELLTRWAGPQAVLRLDVRFRAVTYPGDVITCRGRVTGFRTESGRDIVELAVWCENQDGTKTAEGTGDTLPPSNTSKTQRNSTRTQ